MEEVKLESGLLEVEATFGAIDEDIAGYSNNTVDKGVFKAFKNIMYNQKDIDHYSCTLVSAFTALSNAKDIEVPLEVMQEAFEEYKASGKFTPGFGGSLLDGATFATKYFNKWAGTDIKVRIEAFTIENIIASLKSGFPTVSGIKYGKKYFANEQDDGIIQDIEGTTGNLGHAVAFVKANTMDDQLIKWTENYEGLLKFQIIYTDFVKMRPLFFQSMIRFFE